MKKLERKTRNEKRRQLLNKSISKKKTETNYYPNNNCSDAEDHIGFGATVLNKIPGINRRLLAVILALVFILTVIPATVWLVVKGASAPTYPDLGLTAGNNYLRILNSDLISGTYSLKYNGRTYVFDLDFSPLEKLENGDSIQFHTDNKTLEWKHNVNSNGRVDIQSVSHLTDNANSHRTFRLNDNATLTSGIQYYLETGTDSKGQKTYIVFTPDETVVERTTGLFRGTQELIQKKDVDITFYLEDEGPHVANSVEINGTEFGIKTIYTEASNIETDGIYLIGINLAGEDYIVNYGSSSDGTVNSAYTTSAWLVFYTQYTDHADPRTVYNPSLTKITPEVFSESSNIYDSENGFSQFSLENGEVYLDATSSSLSALKFPGTDVLPEFLAASSNRKVGYHFLKGFDGTSFSDDKRLGSIYNTIISGNTVYNVDTSGSIYLYNVDTLSHDFRTSSANSNFRTYFYGDGSVWKYNNHDLINDYYDLNLAGKYLAANNVSLTRASTPQNNVTLYKMNKAYSKAAITVGTSNVEETKAYTDVVAALPVSYDETETTDDGLVLNKSVKALSDDTFDITLEAHMSKENVVRPDTDVEIVLDTSLAMQNKVYSRDYENLKTYSLFESASTSSLKHDNLYDDDSSSNALINAINAVAGGAWQALTQNRKYQHNKYVEDPSAPGTYVYLHQEYDSSALTEGNLYTNYYRYHFTSSTGDEYSTYDSSTANNTYNKGFFTFGVTAAVFGSDSLPSEMVFYKNGDRNDPNPVRIKTIYHVPGYIASENAEVSLTKNLLQYGGEGKNELYTKIGGEYKQVKIDNNGNGMYTYYVKDNPSTTSSTATYKFVTGGKRKINPGNASAPFSGLYSVFQGFRHYKLTTNPKGETIYVLDDEENNLLSKTLYRKVETPQAVTGLTAMQEALEEFLLKAHERAVENDAIIHVGLVTYDKTSRVDYALKTIDMKTPVGTNTVDTLINYIYNININANPRNTYAAELGQGMQTAYNQMSSLSAPGSRRYTLVFTGGKPIAYREGNILGIRWDRTNKNDAFSTTIANNALNIANEFKSTLQTTVYTVGAYDNASDTMINGRAWYYSRREYWTCDGNPGAHGYWGGSWYASLTGYNIDPADAYATNRMLAYMSSNYENVKSLGLERNRYAPGGSANWVDWIYKYVTRGYGYRITTNFQKLEDGFFFGLSPNTLNDIPANIDSENSDDSMHQELTEEGFKTAINAIIAGLVKATEVPKTNLDATAVLVDGITPYFDLEGNIESIEAKIVRPNDNQVLETLSSGNGDISYDVDSKTINVKGFNYSAHFYDENDAASLNHERAQKLVVKFRIERDSNFLGGNFVPTNQGKSAIYDGVGEDPGVLVERFDIPHVDLKLLETPTWLQDDSVYYSNAENLENIISPVWVDGYRNSYVNVSYDIYKVDGNNNVLMNTYTIPAGATSGTWTDEIGANEENLDITYPQMFDTTQFLVHVNIEPIYEGTIRNETRLNNSATVYVFKPHFNVHDGEVEEYNTNTPRSQFDLSSVPELSWKVYNLDGELIENNATIEELEALLNDGDDVSIPPEVSYGFVNVTESTDPSREVTDANKEAYRINMQTVFQVSPVNITPAPFSYLSHELVTHYYDSEGTEISKEEYDQLPSNQRQTEDLMEWVDKESSGRTAETPPSVSFYNEDHTEWDDGRFEVKSKGYDVTIHNEVAIGNNTGDYRDTSSPFALTLSLQDKNNLGVSKTFGGILPDGTTTEIEFNNGAIVRIGNKTITDSTIGLAHEESFVIKQLDDGFKLSVASPINDEYEATYETGADESNLSGTTATDETIETTISSNQKYIKVTQNRDEVVITGRHGIDSKLTLFLIAAGVLTVLGGVSLAYLTKRRRETMTQAN